jgi:hypothetical protein
MSVIIVIITDCVMICSRIKTFPSIFLLEVPSTFYALVYIDRMPSGLGLEAYFPNILASSVDIVLCIYNQSKQKFFLQRLSLCHVICMEIK